jgi:hypothetical protein
MAFYLFEIDTIRTIAINIEVRTMNYNCQAIEFVLSDGQTYSVHYAIDSDNKNHAVH